MINAVDYWYKKYLQEKREKESFVDHAKDWLEKNSYKYRDEVTDSFRDRDMINDFVKEMKT